MPEQVGLRVAFATGLQTGDDLSKLAAGRLAGILRQYRALLRQTKLARAGLAPNFDQVLAIHDPDDRKPRLERTTDELRDALVAVWASLELGRELPNTASSETKLNSGDLTLPTVGG